MNIYMTKGEGKKFLLVIETPGNAPVNLPLGARYTLALLAIGVAFK